MKSSYILAAGGALLLSACAPMQFPGLTPAPATKPQTQAANPYMQPAGYAQPAAPQTYVPQQPAQPVYATDPMTGQPVLVQKPKVAPQPVYTTDPMTGQPVLVQQPTVAPQPVYTTDPMTGQPVLVQQPTVQPYPTPTQTQPGMATINGVGNDPAATAAPCRRTRTVSAAPAAPARASAPSFPRA